MYLFILRKIIVDRNNCSNIVIIIIRNNYWALGIDLRNNKKNFEIIMCVCLESLETCYTYVPTVYNI